MRRLAIQRSGTGAYTALWVTAGVAGSDHHVTDLTISNSESGGLSLHVGDCSVDGVVVDRVHATATGPNGAGIHGGLPNMVPLFVDAAAGDFHPAAGSPVVVPPATPANVPPSISGLKFSPTAFLPKPLQTPSAAVTAATKPKGSTLRFNATEVATVSFVVEAKVSGRKKGKTCSRTAKLGKKCTTYKAVKGRFSIAADAGANSFRFSGYMNGRPLKAGSYRLVGMPKDTAGLTGGAVKASFKILKR